MGEYVSRLGCSWKPNSRENLYIMNPKNVEIIKNY